MNPPDKAYCIIRYFMDYGENNHRMKAFDIIFFDAGDTLVHPRPSFPGLFVQVCGEHGLVVDGDRVPEVAGALLAGLTDKQRAGWTFSSDPAGSKAFWAEFYGTALKHLGADGDTDHLVHALYTSFSDPANYQAFPDVVPALDELAASGYELGIISNFEPWLQTLLAELDLLDYFSHLIISGNVGVEKPHPRIFELALSLAGTEASRSAHVGDSVPSDVEGAREVGITPILIDRHDRYAASSGILRVEDLREIPSLLDVTRG